MTELSVIIVTYNSEPTICECLSLLNASLRNIPSWEVVLFDNASSDKTILCVKNHPIFKLSNVRLIEHQENIGFGPANNRAVEESSGQYILLLNPDLMIDESKMLSRLLEAIRSNVPSIIGPKLRNSDGSHQVGDAGFRDTISRSIFASLGLHRIFDIKPPYIANKSGLTPFIKVDWVCGACLIMRRDDFSLIEGFDESIFLYSEDVDLCLRAKQRQIEVVYAVNIEMRHIQGISSGTTKVSTRWLESRIDLFRRTRTRQATKIFILILFFGFFLRVIVSQIVLFLKKNKKNEERKVKMMTYAKRALKLFSHA